MKQWHRKSTYTCIFPKTPTGGSLGKLKFYLAVLHHCLSPPVLSSNPLETACALPLASCRIQLWPLINASCVLLPPVSFQLCLKPCPFPQPWKSPWDAGWLGAWEVAIMRRDGEQRKHPGHRSPWVEVLVQSSTSWVTLGKPTPPGLSFPICVMNELGGMMSQGGISQALTPGHCP